MGNEYKRELELELEKERHFVWEGWIRILPSKYLWWHILICSFSVMNSIPIDVLWAIITPFRRDQCPIQHLRLSTYDSTVVVKRWTSIATANHNRLLKPCHSHTKCSKSSHLSGLIENKIKSIQNISKMADPVVNNWQ